MSWKGVYENVFVTRTWRENVVFWYMCVKVKWNYAKNVHVITTYREKWRHPREERRLGHGDIQNCTTPRNPKKLHVVTRKHLRAMRGKVFVALLQSSSAEHFKTTNGGEFTKNWTIMRREAQDIGRILRGRTYKVHQNYMWRYGFLSGFHVERDFEYLQGTGTQWIVKTLQGKVYKNLQSTSVYYIEIANGKLDLHQQNYKHL